MKMFGFLTKKGYIFIMMMFRLALSALSNISHLHSIALCVFMFIRCVLGCVILGVSVSVCVCYAVFSCVFMSFRVFVSVSVYMVYMSMSMFLSIFICYCVPLSRSLSGCLCPSDWSCVSLWICLPVLLCLCDSSGVCVSVNTFVLAAFLWTPEDRTVCLSFGFEVRWGWMVFLLTLICVSSCVCQVLSVSACMR